MNFTNCSFKNDDATYHRIKDLLLAIESYPDMDNNWDPGRMDWWRYNYHADRGIEFFEENTHYWKTDDGQVVGLFISEYGKDDFFIVVHPDYWILFSDILRWGLECWAPGKEKISTSVFNNGRQKIEELLAAGFYEDGHDENLRTYAQENYDFFYDLKPGFEVMSFSEYGNYASRVELARNAFDNPSYTETRLRSLHSAPTYRPELDLVVVNSDGESVAYCMGWVEEYDPKMGHIEPMGVHTDYRRNGFGAVLAKECFKRLAALEVEKVMIASNPEPDISNYLYDSLGPTNVKRSFRYSRDLGLQD